MAHYTRLHGADAAVDEMREVARAAGDVGVRVTLALFMRDRNPLVYGDAEAVLDALDPESRAAVEARVSRADAERRPSRSRGSRPSRRRSESPTFSVQFGPNGPQWCSDELLGAIAEASRRIGRRVHMHLLETRYQRAFADAAYPEGVVARLESLGLLSPRLTLAHCVYARDEDLDAIARAGAIIATNPSSNLHLRSGIAPIGEAMQRGCRVALGVDASALDEDDDILREMRLGHFLHGGWGFEYDRRARGLAQRHRRATAASPMARRERARSKSASPPTCWCSISTRSIATRSCRSSRSISCSRAPAARMSTRSMSPAAPSSASGHLTGVDLDATEAKLRAQYRERARPRASRFSPPGTSWSPRPPRSIAASSAVADGQTSRKTCALARPGVGGATPKRPNSLVFRSPHGARHR